MSTASKNISRVRYLVCLASKNNSILQRPEKHLPSRLYTPRQETKVPSSTQRTAPAVALQQPSSLLDDGTNNRRQLSNSSGTATHRMAHHSKHARPASEANLTDFHAGSYKVVAVVSSSKIGDPVCYETWVVLRRDAPFPRYSFLSDCRSKVKFHLG